MILKGQENRPLVPSNSIISGQPVDKWFSDAIDGAIGGAISGTGIDAGLVTIGAFGASAPGWLLASGLALLSGGAGNAYSLYASTDGKASDSELTNAFLLGSMGNILALFLGANYAAPNLEEVAILASLAANSNLLTGIATAVITGVCTWLANEDFD